MPEPQAKLTINRNSLNILALETSTPVCSVALMANGDTIGRSETGTGIHSEKTFIFIQKLLDEAGLSFEQIDTTIVSGGPGSYTGLRIAASAVKGLMFNRISTLYSCETLAGIAFGATVTKGETGRVHAVLNARRTHLYHQLFEVNDDGLMVRISEPAILPIEDIESILEPNDCIAGTGLHRLSQDTSHRSDLVFMKDDEVLDAANLIKMFTASRYEGFIQKEAIDSYEPVYQVKESD